MARPTSADAGTGELVPVPTNGPVLDGELVDEAEYQRSRARRLAEAARSRLPAQWQDPTTAKQAALVMTGRAAVMPLRYPGAVLRGTAVVSRAWWQWVRVADYYAAAKSTDTLAVRWQDIATVRRRRTWLSLGGTLAAVTGEGVWWLCQGGVAVWLTSGIVTAVTAIAGRHKDGAGGRKTVMGGARTLAFTMGGDSLVEAFRAAGAIGKAEGLLFVQRPANDRLGWTVVIDLPPSRKASDVITKREALASALAVDEVRLILERVRGDEGHAGRLSLWVGHSDPYAAAPVVSPLATAESWDLWNPAPFGATARGDKVALPVVWTAVLIGAIPRMGKTFVMRLPLTAAALDPYVRLIVADGKGGKDHRPFEQVAHRFIRDARTDSARRLIAVLEEAAADVEDRFSRLADMDDELCPESKVTPQITRDPAHGMPLTVIGIDEIQNYLENDTPLDPDEPKGKKVGQRICDLLTYIAKTGPAAGYSLVLATQKPDAKVIPDKLRGQLGTRFALKTMTYQASETILGAGTYKAGMDASKLLQSHKGVGLLLGADGESALSSGEALTVRTHLLHIAQIRSACERGRAARDAAGTLTGDAIGDTALGVLPPEVAALIDEAAGGEVDEPAAEVVDAVLVDDELPEVLGLLVDVIEDDEQGLVAVADLAARIGWEPKRFGEALTMAGVARPQARRQRVNGSANAVPVVTFEAIRAAVVARTSAA
ncbi:cell division protein FtsK [Umezawaea tangerina]|uniref:cell division protein FtsK n=1 Tax=Umezawaea tangerina TaxID=84725 RepID=UPI0011B273DC|nr:cell division protein FtsK [Umezawaea tangerina]